MEGEESVLGYNFLQKIKRQISVPNRKIYYMGKNSIENGIKSMNIFFKNQNNNNNKEHKVSINRSEGNCGKNEKIVTK